MRITIVMGYFLPVPALAGGATEKIWHRIAELMAGAGHEVTIISRQWPTLPNREQIGRVTHLRVPGWNHTRSLPVNLMLDFRWGLRVLRHLPAADIAVCNTVTLPIYLSTLKRKAGKVAVVLGRMPKGQNRLYGRADLILPTSTAVAEKALSENPRLAAKLCQFPNPMDWELHHAAGLKRPTQPPINIGYVGRIHPEKGLETLLAAGERLLGRADLPAWRIRLIGPYSVPQGGGGEAYRDGLISSYGPRLAGRLSIQPPVFDSRQLAAIYASLHVFCYPSRAAKGEGLSIAPIEAMAAGAVPVVSRLDCYRDLIEDGRNGYQFDQESPGAADALGNILARLVADTNERTQAGERAQLSARRFDYQETCRVLLNRFARTLAPPQGVSPSP